MRDVLKPVAVAAAGLVALGVLGACSAPAEAPPAAPAEGTAAQQAAVQRVDAEQFDAAIASGATVIDVRTPAEFASGHIEAAVNINIDDPAFESEIAALDPATTYAVYCRSGNRSGVATSYMADQGFASVYDLSGGVGAWAAAGYPLV